MDRTVEWFLQSKDGIAAIFLRPLIFSIFWVTTWKLCSATITKGLRTCLCEEVLNLDALLKLEDFWLPFG